MTIFRIRSTAGALKTNWYSNFAGYGETVTYVTVVTLHLHPYVRPALRDNTLSSIVLNNFAIFEQYLLASGGVRHLPVKYTVHHWITAAECSEYHRTSQHTSRYHRHTVAAGIYRWSALAASGVHRTPVVDSVCVRCRALAITSAQAISGNFSLIR